MAYFILVEMFEDSIYLIEVFKIENFIQSKLFENYNFITCFMYTFGYYLDEEDAILYGRFTKDLFVLFLFFHVLFFIIQKCHYFFVCFSVFVVEKQAEIERRIQRRRN